MKVYFPEPPPAPWPERLREAVPGDIQIYFGDTPRELERCEVLISGVPSAEELARASNLKALVIPWAGLPARTRDVLREYPHLAVYNLHHNASVVAELAITLMMTAVKRIIPIDRDFRSGDWTHRYESERTLPVVRDTHAVVLGYGAIGRKVAAACKGLGMRVTAINRSGLTDDTNIPVLGREDLRKVLPETRVLIVCLPLTPETEGMLSNTELSFLPDGAVIVNVGRGRIIDERALFEQLQAGRLCAGLDVWYQYPRDEADRTGTLPSSLPFHTLDNVVMTPHIGGNAEDIEARRLAELTKLLNALAQNSAESFRVDVSRGY
jgi:phosphoglycerate dehydrogenase-like enzyme